jgi:Derlin-2/3
MPFLASSLAFALVYVWSRRNPSVKMGLFGVIV